MTELGVGIVGFGFIGKIHALGYRSIPLYYDPPPLRTRMVAVCTSRPETAEAAREKGGFERATTRFEDLLEADDVQIINVCTPNNLHRDQVVAALEAGKHVYCDKPLCLNVDEARDIAAAARAAQTKHQMTFHCRFIPATMRARQLVDEGFLGRVYHFRGAYYHAGYTDPDRPITWRLDKQRGGGGALFDLGSHIIDLMRFLVGEYAEVNAALETFIKERPLAEDPKTRAPVEVDDYALLRVRTEAGALGIVEASRFATGTNDGLTFEIYGEKGALKFDMMEPSFLQVYDTRAAGEPIGGLRGFTKVETVQKYPQPSALPSPKLPVGWERFHIACLYNFLRTIADEGDCDPGLLDGVACQAIMAAAEDSAASGGWVAVERA